MGNPLDADGVRYMVVGGLAMNLLGVPRSTMDVDLVLALDDDNLHHFLATARRLALRPVAPVPLEDILSPEKRRQRRDEKGAVAFALRPLRPMPRRWIFSSIRRWISKPPCSASNTAMCRACACR